MSTIAFIGLGIMGAPMSRQLVKAGHSVIGFNRSPGPVEQLVTDGGKSAGSVAEAVREADVIITIVPDSPDVESLALGEGGVYANAPRGRPPFRCWRADWRGAESWSARPPACSQETSSPVFGSTCTTKTWA